MRRRTLWVESKKKESLMMYEEWFHGELNVLFCDYLLLPCSRAVVDSRITLDHPRVIYRQNRGNYQQLDTVPGKNDIGFLALIIVPYRLLLLL